MTFADIRVTCIAVLCPREEICFCFVPLKTLADEVSSRDCSEPPFSTSQRCRRVAGTPIPQEAPCPVLANSKLSTLLSASRSATPTTLSLMEKEPQTGQDVSFTQGEPGTSSQQQNHSPALGPSASVTQLEDHHRLHEDWGADHLPRTHSKYSRGWLFLTATSFCSYYHLTI